MKDFSVNVILNFSLSCFILCCFFKESLALIRPAKPVIKSAQQLSENTILIEWQDGSLQQDFNEPNLKRYRVFFRNDNSDNLYSWPAQVIKTNTEIKGSHYVTWNASSSFDCYIQCLKNPRCEFAIFKNINDRPFLNCELKNDLINDDKNVHGSLDEEYMKVLDYSNSIVLKNVPAQKNYTFLVAVYDDDLEEWSHVSDESDKVEMKIEISLHYEKIGSKSVVLKWRQTGEHKNYVISRFNIRVKSDQDKGVKALSKNLNKLSKYTLEPDYYQINSRSLVVQVSKEEDCRQKCILKYNCVRYVYFNDNRCYLLSYFNIINGVYRNKDAKAFSIKSDSHGYKLKNLKPESDYLVQLEFRTPFGDVGYSNQIKITTKNQNEVDEEDEYDENDYDSQLLETNEEDEDDDDIYKDLNESNPNQGFVILESSTSSNINNNNENSGSQTNKEDSNEIIDNYDFNEDKLKTTTRKNELNKDDNEDEYYYIYEKGDYDYFEGNFATKKIKKRKTTTPKSTTSVKIFDQTALSSSTPKYDNSLDYDTDPEDNQNENQDNSNGNNQSGLNIGNIQSGTTKAPIDPNAGNLVIESSEVITRKEGDRLEIVCRFDGNTRKELNWRKQASNENLNVEKSSLNSLSLIFNGLTRYNNGYYACSRVDKPNEFKQVQLIVTSKPSKPKIVNATILEEKIYIKFDKLDNGGLNLTNILVEWSNNFNDKNQSVDKKSVNMGEQQKISDNEILLGISIPENNTIRVSVTNDEGDSETSDTFLLECARKNCTKLKTGQIVNPSNSNTNPYMTKKTGIIIFILIALLIVMILIYVLYDCCRSKQEKAKNDKNKNNKENEPLNKP